MTKNKRSNWGWKAAGFLLVVLIVFILLLLRAWRNFALGY